MWERTPDGSLRKRQRPLAPEAEAAAGQDGPAPNQRRPRASTGWALRSGFRDIYDYIGAWIVGSIAWMTLLVVLTSGAARLTLAFSQVAGLVGWGLFVAAAFAPLVGLLGPLTGGLFRYARNAAERAEPEIADFLWGFRSAGWRCIKLAALQCGVAVVLLGDAAFFLAHRQLAFAIAAAFLIYLAAFWGLATTYQWPLLVHTTDRTRVIVRKSLLLALDNLGFSLAIALVSLLLTAVLIVTAMGALLLGAGSLAMLHTQATRELLRRYAILGADPTRDLPPEARTADR